MNPTDTETNDSKVNSFSSPPLEDIPPGYRAATADHRAQHTYTREGHDGKPWLTFELSSRAPDADSVPYFFGHAPLTGRVVLDLVKPEYITSVTIEIEGRWAGREGYTAVIARNVDYTVTFLKSFTPVWTASGASAGVLGVLARHEGEKLEGHHAFDFCIPLPETIDCAAGAVYGLTEFPLPATFVESGARASVFYSIGVVVHRGRLGASDAIYQRMRWAPAIQPPPCSKGFRDVYERGSAEIPSVMEDPDGWETLPSVKVSGETFGQHPFEAEYTLSFAKPACYTRGSVIPLSLTIECSDEQVLDLLAAPSAPTAKLLCNLRYTSRIKTKQGIAQPPAAVHGPIDASYYDEFRATQRATWWALGAQPGAGMRHVRGEIHVEPSLKPGLMTPEFRLFYTIGLFAPEVPSLVLDRESAREGGGRRMPLLAPEVQIATIYAQDSPRPVPTTPPNYDKGEPWPTMIALFQHQDF